MLTGIAQLLVATNTLNVHTVRKVVAQAQAGDVSFIKKLIDTKLISAANLAQLLHKALNLPLLDLSAIDPAKLVTDVLDLSFCREKRLLPLTKRGKQLLIATDDPTDSSLSDQIRFSKGVEPVWVIVSYTDINKFLQIGSSGSNVDDDDEISDILAAADKAVVSIATETEEASVANSPVVKFLKKVLIDAISMGASDLHFEPYEFNYRIRYRIDGQLREIIQPPMSIKDTLSSRIKVISNLDIAEKRIPQDGRTKLQVGDKSIDFRVSTLPTLFGEKVVIRILDGSSAQLGIDSLGYEPVEKKRLLTAIERPYGMVLVTGPTGSGKTVSLYTCLNLLNKPEVNISTAEDPSEINLPGVNQVNMNDKAGLTFATALRAFLRQDPDIIMVGEIRDLETADIAIKAAQTGHMVLSTLHTNDAPTTLTRLLNMGVAPFNVASSVILITAQRLVRRLCKFCKVPEKIPMQVLLNSGFTEDQIDGSWTPYKAVGCEHCNNGFKGRIGIYQVMPISEAIQDIILRNGSALDIANQAEKEGVNSLRESGLIKVMQGVTSLSAVLAVTNE